MSGGQWAALGYADSKLWEAVRLLTDEKPLRERLADARTEVGCACLPEGSLPEPLSKLLWRALARLENVQHVSDAEVQRLRHVVLDLQFEVHRAYLREREAFARTQEAEKSTP